MKREIKFRAWDGKEMSFWEQGKELEFYYTDNFWNDRPTKTVFMQYTGLKDKNGKEIYEGDIVKWPENCNYEVIYGYGTNETTVIGAFCLKGTEMFLHNNDMEVIGNIYSDPHLLNK